ncbi:hypothetical protein LCGC14_1521390 [marine sediment metagenome]|uniref:Uncharacterized protein n=1 Tax=marine sediment metagenome TaxID=412755 RepID=A0A0F9IYI6_9ZZZZ
MSEQGNRKMTPSIWLKKPPTGTGIQLTKVRPFGQLPWNVWVGGEIIYFCPDIDGAFKVLHVELLVRSVNE